MKKIEIYPKVIVYKNTIPRHKEYLELLKKSENEPPRYFFDTWEDWYGFGNMMNLPMNKKEDRYAVDSEEDYAVLQKDFLQDVTDAYYRCTEDYIKEHGVVLPNWVNNGISICKYTQTKHDGPYAMLYHTDYVGANAEAPGKKFAITCTIYINDDYDGGGLSFLREDVGHVIDYKPEAGDIVIFPSGDPITGNSHYFHGVHRVDNGEKYFIRCFWSYQSDGTKEWHENKQLHGDDWEKIDLERMKKSIKSGKWHRHLVWPDDGKVNMEGSTPFFLKSYDDYKKIR
jgi:hypothetical protein